MAFKGRQVSEVAIPDSTTEIGISAFVDCRNITEMIIPDSVTQIGAAAFSRSGLISVTVSKNVTTLNRTFQGCAALKKVVLPDTLISISDYCFSDCTSLESIALPKGLEKIGSGTFNGCENLKLIELPKTAVIIDDTHLRDSDTVFDRCDAKISYYEIN